MRLVPYGPMFRDEVLALMENSPRMTEDEFGVQDLLAYYTAAAYAAPQPYRVLLDGDNVVGCVRIDWGYELPGRNALPSIHEFVAKDGYHMALLMQAEAELKACGYEKYALWVRLDQEAVARFAEKRRGYEPKFQVGLAALKEE